MSSSVHWRGCPLLPKLPLCVRVGTDGPTSRSPQSLASRPTWLNIISVERSHTLFTISSELTVSRLSREDARENGSTDGPRPSSRGCGLGCDAARQPPLEPL